MASECRRAAESTCGKDTVPGANVLSVVQLGCEPSPALCRAKPCCWVNGVCAVGALDHALVQAAGVRRRRDAAFEIIYIIVHALKCRPPLIGCCAPGAIVWAVPCCARDRLTGYRCAVSPRRRAGSTSSCGTTSRPPSWEDRCPLGSQRHGRSRAAAGGAPAGAGTGAPPSCNFWSNWSLKSQ